MARFPGLLERANQITEELCLRIERNQYRRPNLTVEVFDNVRYNLEGNNRFIVVRHGEQRITVSAHELTTLHAEVWIEDDKVMVGFSCECFDMGKSIGAYRMVESERSWFLGEAREDRVALMTSPAIWQYTEIETSPVLYHYLASTMTTQWIYEVFAYCLVATEALDATA